MGLCFHLTNSVDMIRYLAEFKTGAERKDAAENTMVAYKAAQVNNFLIYFLISVQFCLKHYACSFFHITFYCKFAEKQFMVESGYCFG